MFWGSLNENDLASLRKCKIYTPGVSGPPTNLCIEHITASLYDNSLFLLKKGPTMKKWMLMAKGKVKGESEGGRVKGWKRRVMPRWNDHRMTKDGLMELRSDDKDKCSHKDPRHCTKHTRIRVFSDSCIPVSSPRICGPDKTRILVYFTQWEWCWWGMITWKSKVDVTWNDCITFAARLRLPKLNQV